MERKRKLTAGIIAGIMIVLLVGAVIIIMNKKESQIRQLNSEALNMGNSITERDSMLNDLFMTMNDIENTLTVIKQKREQLEMVQTEGSVGMKESILADIKMLDAMLDKSSQKITDLDKKLRDSGVQIASLNKRIAGLSEDLERQLAETEQLKRNIEDRDFQIATLHGKVDELSSEVVEKEQSIAQKSDIISQQDTELNKGYLAYGTFKELEGSGVLEKEGGFLGIGQNKSITGRIDTSKFMKLDIRETREIPLYAKKIKMITEHPDSSYSLKVENGLVTYLEIDNPEEFWRISKYAVIETR